MVGHGSLAVAEDQMGGFRSTSTKVITKWHFVAWTDSTNHLE